MSPLRARQALGIGAGCAIIAQHPSVGTAATQRVAALGLVLTAAALLSAGTLTGRLALRAAPGTPVLALMAYAGWAAASLAWGSPAGLEQVTTLGAAGLLGLVAATLPTPAAVPASSPERLGPSAIAAAIAGAVTAARVGLEFVQGERGAFLDGGQGNANWAGLLLGLALWPVLGLALARRHAARAAATALGLGLVAALVLTESRAAWIGLGAGGVMALLAAHCGRRHPSWWRAALFTAAPFGCALGMTALALALGPLVPSGSSSVGTALAGRAWIWRVSAEVAAANLPLGTGAGAFTAAYLPAQAQRLAELSLVAAARRSHEVLDAHHEWLTVLASLGPLGVVLLATALAAGLAAALRARRPLAVGALTFTVVAMSGDVLTERPGVALLLALLLADAGRLAPGAAQRRHRRARSPVWSGPWPWLGALTLSALLLRSASAAWLAERDYSLADAAEPWTQRARLERAFRRQPSAPQLGLVLGVTRLQQGDAAGAERALEAAVSLRPSVAGLVALGNARLELGKAAAARRAYERAVALAPTSFRARISLASALITATDLAGAERQLAAARQLYPGDPRVAELTERLRLARLARATGAAQRGHD